MVEAPRPARVAACLALLGAAGALGGSTADGRAPLPVDVGAMTLAQKIGQLTQLDASVLVDDAGWLDPAKLQLYLGVGPGSYAVGHVLNTVNAGVSAGRRRTSRRDAAGQGACICINATGAGDCVSTTSAAYWRNLTATLNAFALANGGVPLLYGLDSVHGADEVDGAAWFPHNVALSATFDAELVAAAARVAALDTRSVGVGWAFMPVLGLGMNPLWSRFYETPGEDPWWGAAFGAAVVAGVAAAGDGLGPGGGPANFSVVSPTIKHFAGYSNPRTGHDRTDAWIPDAYFKQYFQPSFEAALRAGMAAGAAAGNPRGGSVMVNSASVNGVPAHASGTLLTGLLRDEVGCADCVALSDWQDVLKLWQYHRVAPTYGAAIAAAFGAGLDVSMVPYDDRAAGVPFFPDVVAELVANGTLAEAALDASVARVLRLKQALGLWETGPSGVPPALRDRQPGGADDFALALNASRASMTLLANSPARGTGGAPVLPLDGWLKSGGRVVVAGPAGDSLAALCGGWTLASVASGNGACGSPVSPRAGATLQAAIAALGAQRGVTVTWVPGCEWSGCQPGALAAVAAAAAGADVVVLALGEAPERETSGDVQDLSLDPAQVALFAAAAGGGAPVVTVLVEARPRVLGPAVGGNSSALLMAYLPCLMGGPAVAETLWGDWNPSGRLPFTYPRTTGDLDVYFHKPWNASYDGNSDALFHNPLFPFGWGLGYAPLAYSPPSVAPARVAPGGTVDVSFTITNTGTRDAVESSLVFVRQLSRGPLSPEVRMLKGVARTRVPAGGGPVQVTVTLNTSEWAYWTPDLRHVLDAGDYGVTVRGEQGDVEAIVTLTASAELVRSGRGAVEMVPHPPGPSPVGPAPRDARGEGRGDDALLAAIDASGALDAGPLPRSMRLARLRDALAAAGGGTGT